MSKRLLFPVLGAVLVYGAITLFREAESPLQATAAAFSVTVVTPRREPIAETLPISGVTVPREEIRVTTELAGVRVLEVLVDVGERVTRGQPLALLDGQSLAIQLAQMEIDYARTLDAFSRVEGIKATGAVSRQLVLEKRLEMQMAKAKRDEGELNLKRCAILAPEDGVIFERNAVIGGLITGSEPLFRIARRADIEMEGMVPEAVLARLKPGQLVSVSLTGEGTPRVGTVRLVRPQVDQATRMAAVRIELPRAHFIPVGLFAEACIVLPEREGLLLPQTALQQDSAGDFVWVLGADNRAERLPVQVTLHAGDRVLVDSMPPAVRVVARAGAFITAGDRLRVAEEQ
jgi:HlyD family secretion protein